MAAMLLVEALDAGPGGGPGALRGRARRECRRRLRARARARPRPVGPCAARCRGADAPTVPQVGEPTYAAKITAADRVLDPPGPPRELHDRVRALSPHIGARLAARRRAAHVWRTRVRARRGPVPGSLARDGAPRCSAAATGALELVELQPPGGRRMPAAAWLRGCAGPAGGDPRVSDARDAGLRVVRRVFDEGAYADRAFAGEAERARARRARAGARDAPGVRHRAAPPHARRGARGARRPPVQRLERRLAHALAARRLPAPVRRRHPAARRSSETVALARRVGERARPGLVNAVLRRIAGDGPGWYAALPEEHAGGSRAAPLAARLDRRALVRRLRRPGARAAGGGQPRAGAVAVAEPAARRRGAVEAWLHEAGAEAVRDPATGAWCSTPRSTWPGRTRSGAAPSCRSPARPCSPPGAWARRPACGCSTSAPRRAARRLRSQRAGPA